ncbi:metal-dependent hydrolase [Paramaledivibacter caminithermalis]|jgi:inner membrane protein|uniref:Inner membrane protein n=1 Tax=Paramaledivibacter caminithermalis (strain DSM 15212 / CIP 107654 / DViRD3) TaxID=1121301 RepID=A0A1M6MDV6_PARC5|nr:metal-dependent hydrolase [Paramaledivibacter caminithermalis]SHJ81644.1 inner membrane protein [Paramaledivibacter caminithermalis DSM 15212]
MDPITHGVIGLAISAFNGEPVSLMNPVSIGCAIGAMAPDIDVVVRLFKDDFHYLKHHRGLSHSIPSLLVLAGIITLGVGRVFADTNYLSIFIWTFLGAFSHTFFDILNSYGAKLLAPFTHKKLKASLLMLYDPVITILCLMLIFKRSISNTFLISVSVTFIIYIAFRYGMRKRAERIAYKHYNNGYKLIKVNVLPALMAFHKWDFVVDTNSHNIVGQVNIINKKIIVREKFKKPKDEIVELFNNTNVGKYFNDFSPTLHIDYSEEMGNLVLKIIDLRYYLKDNFMHHATVVFDEQRNIIESFFQPYDINKYIPVAEDI